MKMQAALGAAILLGLGVSSLPSAEKDTFAFTKVDLVLLEQVDLANKKYDKDGMLYQDEELEAYVTRVGRAMLPSATAPERVRWEFHVLRDPMPNAFAMPNGAVYVHTGLLSLLENEDQLAAVLAHEITHVTDRHTYAGNRDYRKKAAIGNLVAWGAGFAPGGSLWGAAVQLAGSLVPAVMAASIQGYRRELERDADIYSFGKLVEGGYNPREIPNTFRLLQRKDEIDIGSYFYNDHPKLEDRIKYTTTLVEMKAPPPVPEDLIAERKQRYLASTEKALRDDVRLAILANRPRAAFARAQKLTAFHPDSADNMTVLADAYSALGPRRPEASDRETSNAGLKDLKKMRNKLTSDEEERELLNKPDGAAAWGENQRLAEETYRKAIEHEPANGKAYRGLGMLCEKTKKNSEAIAFYRKYLDITPAALDATRIRTRIESLERKQQ